MMSRTTVRFIFFVVVTILAACDNNSNGNDTGSLEIGREVYYGNCLSCHATRDENTLHAPSLNQMSKQEEALFNRSFQAIKIDTLHPSYLRGIEEKGTVDDLIKYIRSYKEQKNIPGIGGDQ